MSATSLDPWGIAGEERAPRVGWGLVGKGLLGGFLVMALVSGAIAAAVLLKVDSIATPIRQTPPAYIAPKVLDAPKPGEPQTILVIGTDHRYGDEVGDARSDTMMLIRLDPKQQATAVLNVPRDLVVDIPGYGTEKINSAYTYGGLSLTAKTIKQTLGLPKIAHAIAVDFKGFRAVVNKLDCVYTDVDRRYYHSNLGLPVSAHYAEIDQQPGYQRLCGQAALDYVRYRHGDSDFVRASRQQNFLRDAKDQIGTSQLVSKYEDLLDIFGKAAQTDPSLHQNKQVLRLIEQGALSAGHPVRQITFPGDVVDSGATGLGSYVTASPDAIAATREEFLHATSEKPKQRAPKIARDPTAKAAGLSQKQLALRSDPASFDLVDARATDRDLMKAFRDKPRGAVHLPLYYPTMLTPRGVPSTDLRDGIDKAPNPRGYTIRDRAGKLHEAYRMVVAEDTLKGDYYGVQGTTWRNPPLLGDSFRTLTMRGRDYRLYYDGGKLRIVAWKTPGAVYWVSNSLGTALSSKQMLGIARSMTRLPK